MSGYRETCRWCGSKATRWQGDMQWCAACDGKHAFATCEPMIGMPARTWSPTEKLAALFPVLFFRFLVFYIPVGWIIWDQYKGWRQEFACWAYGNAYYWEEMRHAN